jgi:hypothetical protein
MNASFGGGLGGAGAGFGTLDSNCAEFDIAATMTHALGPGEHRLAADSEKNTWRLVPIRGARPQPPSPKLSQVSSPGPGGRGARARGGGRRPSPGPRARAFSGKWASWPSPGLALAPAGSWQLAAGSGVTGRVVLKCRPAPAPPPRPPRGPLSRTRPGGRRWSAAKQGAGAKYQIFLASTCGAGGRRLAQQTRRWRSSFCRRISKKRSR